MSTPFHSEYAYQSASVITVFSNEVISNTEDQIHFEHTIVNIIQMPVGIILAILAVIDNESASQAITILHAHVRVIPECACLTFSAEFVKEGVIRGDWTLRHKCGAISVARAVLPEAVPVLAL